MKLIRRIFFYALSITALPALPFPRFNQTGPITYQEIGEIYLSSFKETAHEPSHVSDIKTVFSLFDKQISNRPTDTILTINALRHTLKDLDIYYAHGKNPSANFLSRLEKPITAAGEAVRAFILAHPITDISLLKKRQRLIKELCSNDKFYCSVTQLLQEAHKAESHFLSFWHEEAPLLADAFKHLYWHYIPEKFNTSPAILELGIRLNNLITLSTMAVVPGILTARYKQIADYFHTIVTHSDTSYKNASLAGALLLGLSYGSFLAYRYKMQWEMARQMQENIYSLQTRLIGVATIYTSAKAIQHNMSNPGNLQSEDLFSCLSDMAIIAAVELNNDPANPFNRLQNLLKTTTFKESASFFSYSGRILAAYRLMSECKELLIPYMRLIGELDAFTSIATHLRKDAQQTFYTFAEYAKSHTAYIKLDNFWNLFLDAHKSVRNSLEFTEMRVAIITGSNMSGKSTLLKAIMLNLLLAQTFGICSASQALITPFALLGSLLQVTDEIASGNSLFQAEVIRMKLLLSAASAHHEEQYTFLAIDELFLGTSCEYGEKAAKYVIQKLIGLENNALSIISTHFHNLTELEKEHQGTIVNYKMNVYKDENGTIIRPFILEKGIGTNSIALDILTTVLKK